ncbi:MAG: glycogen/starch synthase, partial [Patescibacteria group bacterium]
MNILFVASELTPWAKVGGLGDVIGSLPKALALQNFSKKSLGGRARLGMETSVIIPRYERINLKRIGAKKILKNFPVPIGRTIEHVDLYQARLPGSKVSVYLVESKRYLSRGEVYFERTAFAGSFKEIQRFVFFSKAVFELLSRTDADFTQTNAENHKRTFDVIHCNDWHS